MIIKKKSVNPSLYTKDYYLSDCSGYNEFKKSYGDMLEPRLKEVAKYLKVATGSKILDIGCGRGELVYFTASKGAESTGIDYSEQAIKLAKIVRAKKRKEIRSRMNFYVMDAKNLNFKDSIFDIVVLTDVVEHLYDHELNIVFKKIKKVLKKDGLLVIHTAPNKIFNDYAYKYYCYPVSSFIVFLWNLFLGKKYPNIAKSTELRTASHAIMHINEPTYFSLKRHLNNNNFKGFIFSTNVTVKKTVHSFKDILYNLIVFFDPISKFFPLNILFGSDFVCVVKNKK